jgi:hypothetical protein
MQVDFGAIERAGATRGNMFAQMGQDIGGTIKKYGDDEKTIKKAQQMAKSISDAIPELAEMGNNALAELNNPELSQRDRLAIAEGIQDSLKLGILGLDRKDNAAMMNWEKEKFNQSMGLERDELSMRRIQLAASMMPDGKLKETDVPVEGGTQRVLIDERGNYYDIQTKQPLSGGGISNALPQNQGVQFPDGVPMGDIAPIDGSYPDYGTFEQSTQGVDVDGGLGVLPPRGQSNVVAQGIADASQPRFGFKPDNTAKQKPELVTLADGTKAYGSFDGNGMFQPARMQDGKPMTFTEGQTLTAKEAIDVKAKQDEAAKVVVGAIDKSENFITLLDKLEAHPGFQNLFGTNVGLPTWVPGSDSADAKVLFKQIDAKGFLEAIKEMKGMGALSNAEGEKASAAFLGLDPSMSENAAKQSIKDAKATIRLGIERAKSGNLLQTESNNPRAFNASRLKSLTPNPLQQ